ncbi:MAG: glutamyl-tRNA reductase [Defluviitaleaceae bacterium]|nr:glutamyl-tRNA reductase [Defluviitaleaceae bacterium]
MDIAVIGVSHRLAPIEIREAVSFTQSRKIEAINCLLDDGAHEVIVLSTCNRSEIYVSVDVADTKIESAKNFFRCFSGCPDIDSYIYSKTNKDAAAHIFDVSAGLDSAILGEDQILGQVKDALELAISVGSSGKTLNRLFTQAITTAKEIKTQTKISQTPLSISYIAVKFLKRELGSLAGKDVMVIGVGKMSRLALNHLADEDVGTIYLANKDAAKSDELREKLPKVVPVPYEDRYNVMSRCDVVVSATASPHLVIRVEDCQELERPLVLMDIAMPRDIDPRLAGLPNVKLFDIDVLKTIRDENDKQRRELANLARKTTARRAGDFMTWLDMSDLDTTIRHLNERCADIKDNSLGYLFRKTNLSPRDRQLVEQVMMSALKKVLREPILNLKQIRDKRERENCIKAVKYLFDIHEVEHDEA